ncbi:hypothetical protein AVEN_224078-1 [Araneus ventricosus]|uniref:Uncharacterized protein n=1 Tax=Araneus ventricosus TaxID=182803 RepID=A0A4Y2IWM8_ARAVE|nr:hypothetical protein AVEN_224078-1 [Araneus ventricosus]
MMMIGSSVNYVRTGGMRNIPVTKAVEHLYATTAKFSGCVILASRPAYSYPPRRKIAVHLENGQRVYFTNETAVQQANAPRETALTSNYVKKMSLIKRYCIINCHLIIPGTTKNGVEEREETQLKVTQMRNSTML